MEGFHNQQHLQTQEKEATESIEARDQQMVKIKYIAACGKQEWGFIILMVDPAVLEGCRTAGSR